MKIYTLIASYRNPPSSLLLEWLKRHSVAWEPGSQEYGIDIARNQGVKRFQVEGASYTHLLMIDSDIVPPDRQILDEPGDLLYYGYVGHQGSKGHVDSFGCGCFRASAQLLATIKAPWFKTLYNDEITLRLKCECSTFEEKARAVGAVPVCLGMAGHQMGGDCGPVMFPNKVLWPVQMNMNAAPLNRA